MYISGDTSKDFTADTELHAVYLGSVFFIERKQVTSQLLARVDSKGNWTVLSSSS